MKVLVVDDSFIIRKILIKILKEREISEEDIFDAPDGEAAMDILNANDIGLLLLDWNMPKLNGLELVKLVRKMEKYKDLPIVMITSEAAKYNVLEAVKAGVSDYITKPVSGMTVMSKIKDYL